MKRFCRNKCINEENCELIQKEKYKTIYDEYSKLYNTSTLRIKKINELYYIKDNIIIQKDKSRNRLIDRVISMTTLIITACSILSEADIKFKLILLAIILIYIIYCDIVDQKNKKIYLKLSKEINDINFNIRVIKDLIYKEDNMYI
ncbi:hypothetical protein [Clostridium butyricum]|uniref:hypothetical protein n=2 Tax=Clostridium TaxID=1485 RepID=UPI0018AB75CD|nr:hypothetical protein [Clostridium butyricum]